MDLPLRLGADACCFPCRRLLRAWPMVSQCCRRNSFSQPRGQPGFTGDLDEGACSSAASEMGALQSEWDRIIIRGRMIRLPSETGVCHVCLLPAGDPLSPASLALGKAVSVLSGIPYSKLLPLSPSS